MKVGIITFYNGNLNYGGILQAYALQRVIESMGYECKQVCLDNCITEPLSILEKLKLIFELKTKAIDIYKRKKEQAYKDSKLIKIRDLQKDGFKRFELSIPHTYKKYRVDELRELDNEFDFFVCGSDQIWTPFSGGFRPVPHRWSYYLNFTKKRKISYAASFGADRIPPEFEKLVLPMINNLDAISVREINAKRILEHKVSKDIEIVVDPVFLIDEKDWRTILKSPKENDFVFSYLLGKNQESRECVKEFSRVAKKSLVTIPFIGEYCEADFNFGDFSHIGATPEEFLGLISNADYVITDSFHGVVFSLIFKKRFVVLKRTENNVKAAMNSRVFDLLSVFGLSELIVDNSVDDICKGLSKNIDYNFVYDRICQESNYSKRWLLYNLQVN